MAASSLSTMVDPHDNPAALKNLEDAIYRDKVLPAREMTKRRGRSKNLEDARTAPSADLENEAP